MSTKGVLKPFVISLAIAPIAFAIAFGIRGQAGASAVSKVLFIMIVLAEIAAMVQAVGARRLFSDSDPGRLTWTLIVAFLAVRSLAELRTATLTFGIVPRYGEGASAALFVYVNVLRYLYTMSDLFFVAALAATIRAYKSTGLKFGLVRQDYLYLLLLCALPVITYAFRDNLIYGNRAGAGYSAFSIDHYIASYRMVGVLVVTLIAALCLIIRRYVSQMGGGAVARVWNTVVIAGAARALSFAAYTLLLRSWLVGADFAEQYLTWIFAGSWLLAAIYQQELVSVTYAGSGQHGSKNRVGGLKEA